MPIINRGVVIVKPKQPFLYWLRALPDPETKVGLDEMRTDCNAYLISEWESGDELERILKRCCTTIFEEELEAWWRVESDWPKKRGLSVFREWFDAECVQMVTNVVKVPMLEEFH